MLFKSPKKPVALKGKLTLPGDKSVCHRAIIFSSLARGESLIKNFSGGDDNLRTLRIFQKLGVEIREKDEKTYLVKGRGRNSLSEPEEILNAGNSGTTLRLMTGLLAGQSFFSVIAGDRSLSRRPMGRVTEPLKLMGARITGRDGGKKAPLAISGGKLKGIRYQMPVSSAQLKSAIILAGLFAEGPTEVLEPEGSGGSRDHTERMFEFFGSPLVQGKGLVRIEPPVPEFKGQEITVPGDISAAAFFLVAALILPGSDITLSGVGLNPGRTGIIEALQKMGGNITVTPEGKMCGEPWGTLRARSSKLEGADFSGALIVRMLDEIPILSIAAAAANGPTRIRDAGELRVKESDRLKVVARELARAGVEVKEYPDGLDIQGGKGFQPASFVSAGDHRIAMAFTVASLSIGPGAEVKGVESVKISYPQFYRDLESLSIKR